MATSSASRRSGELHSDRRERAETSPERTKMWIEPKQPPRRSSDKKKGAEAAAAAAAAVVYYLSRNNHLEHPHYMEVTFSSHECLFLRDFINRLNFLRGQGLGVMYSWSSKRAYKNGYVWHDLSEEDLVPPIHGNEYVLKGTELVPSGGSPSVSQETATATEAASSSSSSEKPLGASESIKGDIDLRNLRKTKAVWNSRELTAETAVGSADASTQTEERLPRRVREDCIANYSHCRAQLRREEMSLPPCLLSSPERLPPPVKTVSSTERIDGDRMAGGCLSGRFRASLLLMNLMPCSSVSVKEGVNGSQTSAEYYGGSLIEAKSIGKNGAGELSLLKRSSSCNVDRGGVKIELVQGTECADAGCMPRKPRSRKEGYIPIVRSANVSKRFTR